MREKLLEATGSQTANQMMHRFYTEDWARARVATLARLVDAAATEGDALAAGILDSAAQELAMLTGAVRGQLWKPGVTAGQAIDAAFIGGVFQSRRLLQRFRMLVELEEGTHCGPPKHGPAEGALLEAYRGAGIRVELR